MGVIFYFWWGQAVIWMLEVVPRHKNSQADVDRWCWCIVPKQWSCQSTESQIYVWEIYFRWCRKKLFHSAVKCHLNQDDFIVSLKCKVVFFCPLTCNRRGSTVVLSPWVQKHIQGFVVRHVHQIHLLQHVHIHLHGWHASYWLWTRDGTARY